MLDLKFAILSCIHESSLSAPVDEISLLNMGLSGVNETAKAIKELRKEKLIEYKPGSSRFRLTPIAGLKAYEAEIERRSAEEKRKKALADDIADKKRAKKKDFALELIKAVIVAATTLLIEHIICG